MISDLIKRALYASGALGLLHRIRNRDALGEELVDLGIVEPEDRVEKVPGVDVALAPAGRALGG